MNKRRFFLSLTLFPFIALSLCTSSSAADTALVETESDAEALPETACTKAYLETEADTPSESESGAKSEGFPQKVPSPTSTDRITPRYRMYHGRPQYRRWNETKARWEDPVWLDGSKSGIKRLTLYTGNTMKLKIGLVKPRYASKPVYWKSQKPKVVCAYKNGRILAKKRGIARVVAIHRKTKRTIAWIKIIVR